MAVKQAEQKSSVVKQAEQVLAQALAKKKPVHHLFRSITQNPAVVVGTHRAAKTAEEVEETLTVWMAKGYDLFQVYLLSSEKGGANKTEQINHMLYILKKQ